MRADLLFGLVLLAILLLVAPDCGRLAKAHTPRSESQRFRSIRIGESASGDYSLQRFDDRERGVTCWLALTEGSLVNGRVVSLSCLPTVPEIVK